MGTIVNEWVEVKDGGIKSFFIGLWPKFNPRYWLIKKAKKKVTNVVHELQKEGEGLDTVSKEGKKEAMTVADALQKEEEVFDAVSNHDAPEEIRAVSGNEVSQSRLLVFKEIMDVLTVPDVNMIGVYGMGGVGKTTLVKQVAAQVREDKLFKLVVTAVVTQTADIRNIQGQIADQLSLRLEEESERARAALLYHRLKLEDKILLVLDDLWPELDLYAIGVPDKDEHKGCKILLTSRNQHVLHALGCQKTFLLGVLPNDEAWDLFQKMVGDNLEDSDLRTTAIQVAKSCSGLPVAIVTVAKALKNKSLSVWRDALRELEMPSTIMDIHSIVELSYNNLESEELKSTFRLCSLMDYNATIRDLLRYGIGLRYFRGVATVEEARGRVHLLVQELKTSCLLVDGDNSEQFAMHEGVRDFGISIASKDHHVFTTSSRIGLKPWHDQDTLIKCTVIWLSGSVIELPEDLKCPKLDLFYVCTDDPDLEIPDKFFEEMCGLKVLHLKNFSLSSLPSSLRLLENLRTLCLDQSILGDVAIIGELKKLEVLSFSKSNIKYLPREIGLLTKLKLLDLSDCSELEEIPPNVISRLFLLEELYMGNSFDQWKVEGLTNQGRDNASLAELKQLSHLTNLEIHMRDALVMTNDFLSDRLQRYRIFIGDVWDWDGAREKLRTLKLKLPIRIDAGHGILMLLKRAEDLHLHELKGVESILSDLDEQGFPQLQRLFLYDSPDIRYIVNTMDLVLPHAFPDAFPVLESLILSKLASLEKICHGKLTVQSFSKLKVIEVKECDKLKNLFSVSVARGLLQLKCIEVTKCGNMEEIVAEESEVYVENDEVINKVGFTGLQYLSLRDLRQFRNFTKQIVFHKLEELELYSTSVEELWHGQVPEILPSIQNLTKLDVDRCGNLKHLFSSSMVESLVQLKYMDVCDCELMEEIIVIEELREERMTKMRFPKLEFLRLWRLPKLVQFCSGHLIECPLLKRLWIEDCPQLKTFISNFSNEHQEQNLNDNCDNVIQALFDDKVAFPGLAEIEISRMDNLEKIWHSQLGVDSFGKLRTMKINGCGKLVNIFPSILLRRFQSLEKLTVRHCSSLEVIFDIPQLMSVEVLAAFRLRDLDLQNLPNLKHIWNGDPQGILSIKDLRAIHTSNCQVLKNLFPFSIAIDLLQLEELEIEACGVEEIVAKDAEATRHFVFPQLTSLKLKEITKCRSFYPGNHTWECSKLERLDVYSGDIVKLFNCGFLDYQEIHEESQLDVPIQQKVIPSLKELLVDGEDTTTSIIWHGQFPEEYISTLDVLKLQHFNHESDFPFGFLQRLHNLEKLIVERSSFVKLFSNKNKDIGTCAQLRSLEIDSIYGLLHIWDEDYPLVPDPQNLWTLKVRSCHTLVNLAPASASFRNLTTLDVYNCNGLLYLMTSSMAEGLVHLKKLEVDDCMMTEIVATQGNRSKDQIIFSKLEYLVLVRLHNLTSFCSGNYIFKFPSLKELTVEECPKMSIFSPLVLITPKLMGVRWKKNSKDLMRLERNLNDTIGQLCGAMVGLYGLEDLKLSEFPQLKEIWCDQLPAKFLSNLRSLVVDECAFVSNAVPSNLLRFLNRLKELDVRNCNSLEGIFDLERLNVDKGNIRRLPNLNKLRLIDLPRLSHIWNKDPQGILDFKNLALLEIHNCSSLRNVFTPSMALGLEQLQKMEIRNCAMMEEIITKERAEEAAIGKIIFPQLKIIILNSLTNLTSFYSGTGVLEFPSLGEITVDSFPNMKTFISSVLREKEPTMVDEGKEQRLDKGDYHIPTALFFNHKVAIPNLQKLSVEWNHTMEEIRCGQFQAKDFSKLKTLELINLHNSSVAFAFHFLQRFTNLEKLVVSNAFIEEIVPRDEVNSKENHIKVLQQLRELELSKLPNLVQLSKEDSQPCLGFRSLETLKVLECGRLKILVPSSLSFECLMTLEVSKCHGLVNLMTFSAAKCLVKLMKMIITECELIKGIVANEENEVENEVIFHKLEYLSLKSLPCLTSFYLGNCAFMFPSLGKVQVTECPEMKIFSRGVINTPELKQVLLTDEEDKCYWQDNLNATIAKLYDNSKIMLRDDVED